MADWCCLSQRAAALDDDSAAGQSKTKAAPPAAATRRSAAGSTLVPSNLSPNLRHEVEQAAHERSFQKSPRRLSPARRPSADTAPGSAAASPTPSLYSNPATVRQRRPVDDASAGSGHTKIILLGAGESGKSTIAKQMKILHNPGGFSEEDLLHYRPEILRNVVEAMQQVLLAMDRLDIRFGGDQSEVSQEWAGHVRSLRLHYEHLDCLPQQVVEAISYLWIESGIRNHFAQLAHVSYVIDSAQYFFDNVDRYGRPDFLPTPMDILRARTKTTGILKTTFKSGMLRIDMYDVGGQRTERRRWVQVFENVTTVIFCVALSEYDQMLAEDPRQNRLMESFQLFDNIVNSRWFQHSSIVLFLNKSDIFRQKLHTSPLSLYFPEFTGGADFEAAVEFIRDRFLRLNRSGLPVYAFLTCATDTDNITAVFGAVKETVLRNVLLHSGLV